MTDRPDNNLDAGDGPTKSDIDTANNEAKHLFSIGSTFLAQPFVVSRTLMQVGYEPFPAELGVSLFRRIPGYYYPNTYRYLWFLRKAEGTRALFTGMTAKLINAMLAKTIEQPLYIKIKELIPCPVDADEPIHKKGIIGSLYEIAVDCINRSVMVAVTQPFHVVMVRMICSVINKDKAYQGLYSSIKEIYNTEGLSGFYSGMVPRWISEVATIVMSGGIMYIIYRMLENAVEDESVSTSPNHNSLVQFYVYGLVYKYQVASTVTAASCPGLDIGLPVFESWKTCFSHLQVKNQLGRGQSMFYRSAGFM